MSLTRISRAPAGTFDGGGIPVLSPAEEAVFKRSDCTFYLASWLNYLDDDGIRSAKGNILAAPVDSIMPSYFMFGSDGHPEYRAQTSFPSGTLMTPVGIVSSSFTIDFVGISNTTVFNAGLVGIAGDDGGAIAFALRAGDLMRVLRHESLQVVTNEDFTILADVEGVTTGNWHHVIISYDLDAQTLRIWVNGVLGVTAPDVDITQRTSRLTLFGSHDLEGFTNGGTRGARLTMVRAFSSVADTPLITSLVAGAEARFPSIYE